MEKRFYIALSAVVVFFGLGFLLDYGIGPTDHLEDYAIEIEKSIQEKEKDITTLLKDTAFINRILLGVDKLTSYQQQQDIERLKNLTVKPFNLTIYDNDSLVFWLNNRAFLTDSLVGVFSRVADTSLLMRFPNGYFEVVSKRMLKNRLAIGLIPVKREYAQDSHFLASGFETDAYRIPHDVYLDSQPTDFPVHNTKGEVITWLNASGPAADRNFLRLLLFVFLLGFLALGLAINDAALLLVRRYQPWVGALFMFAAVILVRWLTIRMNLIHRFEEFETFKAIFTEPFVKGLNSLGELLISMTLLLWMMVFFNREFHVKDFHHPSRIIRFLLTLLNYLAIMLGMFMVSFIFKNIIVDSKTVFDFDNVFNLNSQSVMAMIGVVLLLFAFFLFSHRMMMAIYKIILERSWRLGALLSALLLMLPILYFSKLDIAPTFFLLAAIAYVLMLELFVEVRNVSVGWLVGWLMLFSALAAGLLYKYNSDKDFNRRKTYARELAIFKDSLAEKALLKLQDNLLSQPVQEQLLELLESNVPEKKKIRQLVEMWQSTDKYLLHNYRFSLAAFQSNSGKAYFPDQSESQQHFNELYGMGQSVGSNLQFMPVSTRMPGYLLRLNLPSATPVTLFVSFQRSFSSPSKVYTELLIEKKYKNLMELDEYDYGIYLDNVLIEERNKSYSTFLSDSIPPLHETVVLMHTSKRSEILYAGDDGIAIIIGKDLGGYIKPLSLFSYVFTLLAIAVIVFSGLNYLTDALPGPLNFLRTMRISLRNRLQFWIISAIIVSFVGLGVVTVLYFQQSSNEYHKDRLDRKVTSALASVNYEISILNREGGFVQLGDPKASKDLNESNSDLPETNSSITGDEGEIDAVTVSNLIQMISEVHRLDVNVYNTQGNLMASSEANIFEKGLVAPKMGFYALQELNRLGYERSNQEESIGDMKYLAAYVPLRNASGSLMAYMGIPYYLQQQELHKEVTDFMSTLLNVYIFLLLIAGGLAIFIATNITKALAELSQSLQRLRLGYNQPIVWERNDEIGDLVNAYNNALIKIEESSRMLRQTEREGAWREMAMQVAHEVKNPLTPMKLSIQYLQKAYKADLPDKEGLVKRVSETLIEQIEALTQIANEFSNFAKMPKAQNTQFSINEVAASVHGLFANEKPDMDVSLYLPDKQLFVFADRGHITRVLNNLVKNAIQSIPDDKKGIIEVFVHLKENDENTVIMAVKDNGQGIPEEIQSKVFTPNFSTRATGSGLGLALSKNIVVAAQGAIYFETKEGAGTTFFVELPLAESKDVDLEG